MALAAQGEESTRELENQARSSPSCNQANPAAQYCTTMAIAPDSLSKGPVVSSEPSYQPDTETENRDRALCCWNSDLRSALFPWVRGGSPVVIRGAIRPVTWVITIAILLVTLLP